MSDALASRSAGCTVTRVPASLDVYVGVGSNIEPEAQLRAGVGALQAEFDVVQVSSVYRSPAFGFVGDDFLNVVVALRTQLGAEVILARLDAIENAGGRTTAGRFAPRALDCDLLMYGCCVDARRRLPRDDVLRYPFVLGPLAEIAPALRHPLDGRTMAGHWRARAAAADLRRVCAYAQLPLPADAAPAVHGQDLAGDVRRITGEI